MILRLERESAKAIEQSKSIGDKMRDEFTLPSADDGSEEVKLPYNGLNNFKRLQKIGTINDGTLIKVRDMIENTEVYYVVKGKFLYLNKDGTPINNPLNPVDVLSVSAAPDGWDLEGVVSEEDLEGLEGPISGPH